jgi:hypothetical protein
MGRSAASGPEFEHNSGANYFPVQKWTQESA